jgi:hypothetical protein
MANIIRTPSDHIKVVPSLDPESRTAAADGLGVDCRGFSRALMVIHQGAHDITTGDEAVTYKVQESSDDASADAYADVTGATQTISVTEVPNATAGETWVIDIDLDGRERYLRAVATPTGTTPIDVAGVVFYLFNPALGPPEQENTPVQV